MTGCNGFVGSSLRDSFQKRGIGVIPISRFPDGGPNLIWLRETENLLAEADWLVHAAWQGTRRPARLESNIQRKNVEYARVLGNLCQSVQLRKIIGMGSQDEFGTTPTPWHDESPTAPTSAYAHAKLEVREAFEGTGVSTLWLRLFSVVGPGDTHRWIFTEAVAATLAGKRLEVGPCDNQWSFTHVDDVCNAAFLLASSGRQGPFCVTTRSFAPLRQYLEQVPCILGKNPIIDFNSKGQRGRDINAVPSGLLAFGWSPKHSFEQSVLTYVGWLSRQAPISVVSGR